MPSSALRWWQDSCDLPWEEIPSGSRLRQVTSAPALSTVIYHEQPFCSADGKRIAIFRSQDVRRWVPGELLVYDIENHLTTSLLPGSGGQDYVATSAWSGVLFAAVAENPGDDERRLWRADLNTLKTEVLAEGIPPMATISADLRFGLHTAFLGKRESNGRREMGLFRTDFASGEREMLYRSPHIGNAHLQYRLRSSSRILVQENFGWIYDEFGNFKPGSGSTSGLFSLAADGGDRRDFPVGGNFTPPTTGHECWIGDSDRVLVSLSAPYDDGRRRGTLLELSHEWENPRVVFDSPYVWNHVSASRCGRFFVADCYDLPGTPLLVGHIDSGQTAVLCDSKAQGGGGQHTHAHPYFTSDNKWIVFNSNHMGITQVFLASVPDRLLEKLAADEAWAVWHGGTSLPAQ